MAVSWSRTRTIARTEIRRRWRTLRANPSQLLGIALLVLFLLPGVIALVAGAYFAGTALRAGDVATPIDIARQIAVLGWLFAAVFGVIRGYTSLLDPDNRDGLLTTISHGQLLAGVLLAEGVVLGTPAVATVVLASLAFALAVGTVVAGVAMLVSVCFLLSSGFVAGIAVALLIKNGGVRSRLLYRLRTAAFLFLFVAYFGVLFTNSAGAVLDPLFSLLTPTPIGWLGEASLLAAGVDTEFGRAAGGLLIAAGVFIATASALPQLTGWLWYADGLETTGSTATTATGWLSGRLPQPLAGVVAVDWTRARRAPITLSYVLYPLFILMTPILETVQTGRVSGSFPVLAAVCGAWITGALFSLNIVGNEGRVLPATVLTASPARALVGGHVAAGVLLGLPVTIVTVAALGLAGPQSPATVVTLTIGTAVLAGCAALIATGIGAAFPRHEAVSVSRSRKAIIPSTFAFAAYSIVVAIVALPLLATHTSLLTGVVADVVGVPPIALGLGGIVVTAVLGAAFGLFSTLYALRAVRGYRME